MSGLPPFATRDRAQGAVLVVCCGIVQALALAVAAFATRDAFAALHQGQALAPATLWTLAAAGAVGALALHQSRRHAEGLGQSYAIALRRALYQQIAALPKSRHDRRRTGALSLRFVGDLSAARLWFGRGLPDVLTALIILPGAIAVLCALSPGLALAGLIPLGLALVIMAGLAWHLGRTHRGLRSRRANIAISMIERIAIAPELDLAGRTRRELRTLDEKGAALRDQAVARRSRISGLMAVLHLGAATAGLAILWMAAKSGLAPALAAAALSVLALVALPLQNLASAWDRYCAWVIAREKAQRLFDEQTLSRGPREHQGPAPVTLTGAATFTAKAGAVTILKSRHAGKLAQVIAGLDDLPNLTVDFGTRSDRPHVAYIGDMHIGLQGSLRRSVTLSAQKRPPDAQISFVLSALGLAELQQAPGGLDQRIAENGRGLDAATTLRIDLARAVLGRAEVIVISSHRWAAEPQKDQLLGLLQNVSPATIILAHTLDQPSPSQNWKAP